MFMATGAAACSTPDSSAQDVFTKIAEGKSADQYRDQVMSSFSVVTERALGCKTTGRSSRELTKDEQAGLADSAGAKVVTLTLSDCPEYDRYKRAERAEIWVCRDGKVAYMELQPTDSR
ncbi:hypothetical protein A5N17_06810 [Arthrobacter sp. D2]|nr:hypothetical protein [Arthrobacter sp. M5]NKR17168.1 hypothetical protein [Arthrobacter sp. M6]OEH61848.1 hypothetical protein A5N13_15830 [Arthrobacter sp. D4]OEH64150.1 hypothetical protein A5N17_06810 [Arthrobacter sp. D2]